MEIDNEDLISLLLLVGMWIRLYSIFRHRQRMDRELLMRRRNFFHRLRRRRLINLRRYQLRVMHVALLGVGLHHAIVLRRQQRSVWVRPRTSAVWDEMWLTLTNDQWKEHFRMSKDTFQFICEGLRPNLEKRNTRFHQSVTVEKKLAVALWRLATNVEFRTISRLFGIGMSTACSFTHEVCQAIQETFEEEFLKWPEGEQLNDILQGFELKWGFPQAAGAIDGTHIPVLAPTNFPQDYHNRKGHHSVVLQAVVDYRYRFTDVFVGWPGRAHDARVLSNSDLYTKGQNGTLFPEQTRLINGIDIPIMILGDPAYPLLPWLMKGFSDRGRLTPEQQHFNYRLSRARMVVECAFGRLKARWRCLLKRNDSDILKIPQIVMACCIPTIFAKK